MSMILTLAQLSPRAVAELGASPDADALFEIMDAGVDLDKAWHGIHFMLAGEAWGGAMPAATLLLGGRELGEDFVGYGPARLLSPSEVSSFNDYLVALTKDAFDARFNAQAMIDAKIYPDIWERDLNGEPDGRPYMKEYFSILKEYVAAAAQSNAAMLITIS
jgi:hypothetical protein